MRIGFSVIAIGLLMCVTSVSAQTLRLKPKVETATDGLDQVLARHAKRDGFDYAALQSDAVAKRKLSAYLKWAEAMPESAPLADFINAYNALVISSVLAKLPLASVMDDKGFFGANKHQVAGKARTLDELENQIIRPRFHDARVHFALNCGARSCPTLHGRALRTQTLDQTLDTLTRAALKDPRHLSMSDKGLTVSAILFWFEADFVRAAGSIREFLRKYAEPAVAARITDDLTIVQGAYDWSLNRAH